MSEPLDRSHLPHACGVYIMRDAAANILYIGKAIDLAKRVAQYFNPNKEDLKNSVLAPLIRKIDYISCSSEREALILERRLIRRHQPFFNSMWKDDKSYPFIKVTLGEDFPRVLMTRKKIRDGGAYFGPYPQSSPIKSLLGYLWRQKFFPLRPCRWDFSTTKPLDKRKITSCLYYHTGECPAPCAGKISPEGYRAIAERAVLFFKGEYGKLKQRFETEMKMASGKLEYEKAAQLRDNIRALEQMGERVRVQSVREEDVSGQIASSEAVSDLQRALGLASPPFHVECFDISHFQGRQTVASMVCFKGGEPFKDHYRKFRIKEVAGIDDFKSMAEVVRRRYQRLKTEGGLPDLVLVDGGKGQLSAALSALQEIKVKVPLASLAKRVEEVFLPGKSESIIMERGRPALRLLQRLRDEAHRFGITYHRLLRKKALLG
ncbi:MAG: excinuclease ABC subunit UvrC [Elusimicrobia bacterium]|nr:excinuclease ABC subunit UvrC [Elusimicrobiota bacterium]